MNQSGLGFISIFLVAIFICAVSIMIKSKADRYEVFCPEDDYVAFESIDTHSPGLTYRNHCPNGHCHLDKVLRVISIYTDEK